MINLLSIFLSSSLAAVLSLPAAVDGLGLGIGEAGSPHNFADNQGGTGVTEVGAGGWNGREEICRVCHVPHDHNRDTFYGDAGLLWNHALSSATYTMYTSTSLDGAIEDAPTGYSKMCLACHDGTVGVDTFDKYAGGNVFIGNYNSGFQVPGALYETGGVKDLQATHPISITYDEVADPDLQPKTTLMGGSGSIEDVLQDGTTLQCSTCHDVHDQPGESVAATHLLRVSQKASQGQASGLCLTCHIK